jgi:hypothetical protein
MINPIIALRSIAKSVENEIRQSEFQYDQVAIACNALKNNKEAYNKGQNKLFQILGRQKHLKNNVSAIYECIDILKDKLDVTYNMK